MRIWKRNAVVATVALFVCVALYLSWSYNREGVQEPEVFDPYAEIMSDTQAPEDTELIIPPAQNLDGQPSGQVEAQPVNDYFSEARLSRQRARDSALNILKEAAALENVTSEARDQAGAEIETMAGNAIAEARIEGLVVAKGFNDCVAFISKDGINIVVAAPVGGLSATDVVKIKDIVTSETSLAPADMTIVEVTV